MNEFNSRMDAQRTVLAVVNKSYPIAEELCGLSSASISRWASSNSRLPEDAVLQLLLKIGDKLSFLATKSQEQITEDYKKLSIDISQLLENLKITILQECSRN